MQNLDDFDIVKTYGAESALRPVLAACHPALVRLPCPVGTCEDTGRAADAYADEPALTESTASSAAGAPRDVPTKRDDRDGKRPLLLHEDSAQAPDAVALMLSVDGGSGLW